MTARPMTITLRTSDGKEVSLLAGRGASWPEQADFSWCGKDEDGKPALHHGKFGLRWGGSIAGVVVCEVDWSETEVNEDGDDLGDFLGPDNVRAVEEAASDFESAVTRALKDEQAMLPFANLDASRIAAHNHLMLAWQRLPSRGRIGGVPAVLSALAEDTPGLAATTLRHHVEGVIHDAEKAANARAAAAYEAAGGVYPGSEVTGSERTNLRSVPAETARDADAEIRHEALLFFRR